LEALGVLVALAGLDAASFHSDSGLTAKGSTWLGKKYTGGALGLRDNDSNLKICGLVITIG
jgi:hypothetical protein